MSGNLVAAVIVGFIVIVFVYSIYWTLVVKPRLRTEFKAKAEAHGWTYTAGKSLIVNWSSKGYLLSPQETITDSIQGSTEGIKWSVDAMTVTALVESQSSRMNGNSTPTSVNVIIWHSEDVRIEHGSVLLFPKAEGWGSVAGDGMLKAGLKAVYAELIHDLIRTAFNIQNTPVTLGIPEFDAKYRIEVSDMGAAQIALTADVRAFLLQRQPPTSMIQLGDNALDVLAENATYFSKVEQFEKLADLANYGAQLAHVVAASQSTPNPQTSS